MKFLENLYFNGGLNRAQLGNVFDRNLCIFLVIWMKKTSFAEFRGKSYAPFAILDYYKTFEIGP